MRNVRLLSEVALDSEYTVDTYDKDHIPVPERCLLIALLDQSIRDLTTPGTTRQNRRAALKWFNKKDQEEYVFSYRSIADTLELNRAQLDYIQSIVDWAENQDAKRKPPGEDLHRIRPRCVGGNRSIAAITAGFLLPNAGNASRSLNASPRNKK